MVKIRHLAAWMRSEPLGPGKLDNQPLFMDDDIIDSIGLNADTDEIEIRGKRSTSNEQFVFRASILRNMGTLTIVKGARRDIVQICDDAPDKAKESSNTPEKAEKDNDKSEEQKQ